MDIFINYTDIKNVGILRVWGYYNCDVFSISHLSSKETVLDMYTKNNRYLVNGSAPLELIKGTASTDFTICKEYADELRGTSDKKVTESTFAYQNALEVKRIVTEEGKSSIFESRGLINYNLLNESLSGAITTQVSYFLNKRQLTFSTSNMFGSYLLIQENGINYFFRIRIIFQHSSDDSANGLVIEFSTKSKAGDIFFGGSVGKFYELKELGDGSFSYNQMFNPFDPLPPSGENTPGGQFDDQSDIIGDSSLPTLSASDTGFTRIYIPTLSQVKDLARYLWTDDTVIETIWNKIKQFFENPMEAIIGFNLVPVPVPSSGTKSFALMYIDTGVDMDTAANQFVDVDCGTLPIQLYYGSALDYSPYTKISCYLPYIGMVQLNTDEVVGRTLQVKYRIDIVSGSCVAKIFVDGNCIYQYSGHCAITIPIAASDFSSYVSAAISVAKLAVGAATGGAGGAAAAALNADVNQQTGSMFSVQGGSDNSGQIQLFAQGGASGPGTQAEPEIKNTQASFSGITPQNVANTVGEIMTAKPHVQHSGSFSGNSGYLGVRRPFVIIERPNLCLPENYQGLNGFPAMITMVLGECSGYTKVQQMVLSGCTATNPEQAEIMSLLKGGVIL